MPYEGLGTHKETKMYKNEEMWLGLPPAVQAMTVLLGRAAGWDWGYAPYPLWDDLQKISPWAIAQGGEGPR